jgi:hypothetical protein
MNAHRVVVNSKVILQVNYIFEKKNEQADLLNWASPKNKCITLGIDEKRKSFIHHWHCVFRLSYNDSHSCFNSMVILH